MSRNDIFNFKLSHSLSNSVHLDVIEQFTTETVFINPPNDQLDFSCGFNHFSQKHVFYTTITLRGGSNIQITRAKQGSQQIYTVINKTKLTSIAQNNILEKSIDKKIMSMRPTNITNTIPRLYLVKHTYSEKTAFFYMKLT